MSVIKLNRIQSFHTLIYKLNEIMLVTVAENNGRVPK